MAESDKAPEERPKSRKGAPPRWMPVSLDWTENTASSGGESPPREGHRALRRQKSASDGEPPVSRPPLEIPTAEPGDDVFAPRGADAERVIYRLDRFGVDETADGHCDWRVFGAPCGLSDRTPAEVEAFVASVVTGLQIHPKTYDVTPRI
jgi:hypothetical protein